MRLRNLLLLVFSLIVTDAITLPAAHLLSVLATTVATLKIAQYQQKQKALKRRADYVDLIGSFNQEDWQKFRQYTHAAKIIKELFNARNLNPKDFGFRWCQPHEGWSFCSSDQYFSFEKLYLEKADELLLDQDLLLKRSVTIRYGEGGMLTLSGKEYIDLLRFTIGHEIQHACDSKALREIHSSLLDTKIFVAKKVLGMDKDYFSKYKLADIKKELEELDRLQRLESEKLLEQQRLYEKKADIHASLNPDELRTGAKCYRWSYEEHIKLDPLKWEHFYQHEDEHPHPLERARYLSDLADKLEKERQEKQIKQAQFEQKYLVLSN